MLQAAATCLVRVPHWRWLRAEQILDGGPPVSVAADGADSVPWIRRAVQFLRRLRRCHDSEQQMDLASQYRRHLLGAMIGTAPQTACAGRWKRGYWLGNPMARLRSSLVATLPSSPPSRHFFFVFGSSFNIRRIFRQSSCASFTRAS